MIITRLEELDKGKVKVYIEEEYTGLLYVKEIRDLKLAEGEELTQSLYNEIMEKIIYPRAQQKAISILKFMDRSEAELRKKLLDAGFTDDIIDKTIIYVSNYGYLNDKRFAASFLRARIGSKSKLVIKTELSQKGVSKEIINNIIAEEYDNSDLEDMELIALRKAIAKKTKSPESLEYDKKQKLIASLYRKGFDLSKIRQVLEE